MKKKSRLAVVLLVAMVVAGVAVLAVVRNGTPDREIVLEVRDMRFYLAGSDLPNPTLRLRAGETVRIVLLNEERGMLHDFAVPDFGFATEPVLGGPGARASELVTVPREPGRHEYLCTLHTLTMRGAVEVVP